jgi:hypothetical protein
MIAVVLFTVSAIALGQFALYYWRAVLAGVASQPLSERLKEASGIDCEALGSEDFGVMMKLHDLTPGLREHNEGLRTVRLYYNALKTMSRIPRVADWANREMTTCARYAAVVLDRRLTANMECAAEIRSI